MLLHLMDACATDQFAPCIFIAPLEGGGGALNDSCKPHGITMSL